MAAATCPRSCTHGRSSPMLSPACLRRTFHGVSLAPWHYVDVPLDQTKYDKKWSADDPKHGCVVDKINEFRATLKDKTKSVEDRRFALRFLIHCVEDMHMPMHVGDNHDRGATTLHV